MKRVIIYFLYEQRPYKTHLVRKNRLLNSSFFVENKEKVEVNCIKLVYAVICRGRKSLQ